MATDYALNLKATLDTSEVQQKLQALGQTGTAATSNLENAVKSLDQSIKQLSDSWKTAAQEQQKATAQASSKGLLLTLTRGAGVRMIGNMLGRAGGYAEATGHSTTSAALGFGGAALRGAGMGAVVGSAIPGVGTAIGAAIGTAAGFASEALDRLADSAEKAAQTMEEVAKYHSANVANFEAEAMRRQIETLVPQMSNEKLLERREFLSQDITEYNDFLMSNHAKLGQAKQWGFNWTGASWEIRPGTSLGEYEKEQAKLLLEQTQHLKEQADLAQREIDAIDKELKERGRFSDGREDLAEMQQEEARMIAARLEEEKRLSEAIAEREAAEDAVAKSTQQLQSKWQKETDARLFTESLKNMSPKQLLSERAKWLSAASDLESERDTLAQQAIDTGDKDIADKALLRAEEASNARSRFQEIDNALNQLVGKTRGGSLQSYLGDNMSTEASKGYDVGGYAKLEDAIWRQQLDVQKQIDSNTLNSAESLKQLVEKVELIQQNVADNNIGANWGD